MICAADTALRYVSGRPASPCGVFRPPTRAKARAWAEPPQLALRSVVPPSRSASCGGSLNTHSCRYPKRVSSYGLATWLTSQNARHHKLPKRQFVILGAPRLRTRRSAAGVFHGRQGPAAKNECALRAIRPTGPGPPVGIWQRYALPVTAEYRRIVAS